MDDTAGGGTVRQRLVRGTVWVMEPASTEKVEQEMPGFEGDVGARRVRQTIAGRRTTDWRRGGRIICLRVPELGCDGSGADELVKTRTGNKGRR